MATATQVPFKNKSLTETEISRYNELTGKLLFASTEERKELFVLVDKAQALHAKHQKDVDGVTKQIKDLEIEIHELFGKDDVAAAYKTYFPKEKKATNKSAIKRASESNLMLLKDGKFKYFQGRIFEPANAQVTAPWVAQQTPPFLLQHGTSDSALIAVSNDDGKAYFDTPEGTVELKAIVDFVTKANQKIKGTAEQPAAPKADGRGEGKPAVKTDAKPDPKSASKA